MAGPFPGMDPYIEALGSWPDFHLDLIARSRASLGRTLPPGYVPRMDERVVVVAEQDADRGYDPDVMVLRHPRRSSSGVREVAGATATIEPVMLPIRRRERRRTERHVWLEVRKVPELKLITVIEVLSPTNKIGRERQKYLRKRADWLDAGVHLVEIDLLVSGGRMPVEGKLPPGDYFATVARKEDAPNASIYAWSVRQLLPRVPIPLERPDADATLDLGALVSSVHEEARYAEVLPYHLPLKLNLAPEDREWAEGIARGAAHR